MLCGQLKPLFFCLMKVPAGDLVGTAHPYFFILVRYFSAAPLSSSDQTIF
jgi:hypothetical protein